MKKNQAISISLIVGTALACLDLPASADTESFTASFGSALAPVAVNGTDLPISLTLPEFDASLGNLTDIEVVLTTTGLLQADVANVGAATTFTDAQATGTITVTSLADVQSSVPLTTTPFSGSIASGTPASPAFSLGPTAWNSETGVSQVPSSGFGAWEASGSGSSLGFSLNATFNGNFSGNGPLGLSFAGDASAFGSVEVDYTYVAVPEPKHLLSLSLLSYGGFLALNRMMRRAHSTKPSPSDLSIS